MHKNFTNRKSSRSRLAMTLLLVLLTAAGTWALTLPFSFFPSIDGTAPSKSLTDSELIVIGSGDATNGYFPTYCLYNNSLTQQIYTAEEIGATVAGKAILSIDFRANSSNSSYSEITRNLDIYMVNTDSTSFSGSYSWIVTSAEDLVFSGDVTFVSNEWTTITLDNEFEYNGTNLAVIVDDNTGNWKSGFNFLTFTAENQSIRIYSDGTDYDPFNPSSYNGTVQSNKNQIRLLFGEKSVYPKPTGLTATEVTGTTATLTWTENGTATAWVVEYSTDRDFENDVQTVSVSNDTTTTLTGLTPETTYYARVKSSYGEEGESNWSSARQFTTPELYPTPSGLTASSVTGTTATLTWTENGTATAWGVEYSTDSNFENDVQTVNVSDDATTTLTGLTPETTYYARVKASYGEGSESNWSAAKQFTTLELFPTPSGLTASRVTGTTATLTWTENGTATEWVVEYSTDSNFENDVQTVNVSNDAATTLTGLTPETKYYARVKTSYGEEGESNWSAARQFTTLELYPAPSGLTASNVTQTTATLTWTENGTATEWVLEYTTDQNFENDVQSVTVSNEITTTLTGLTPETTYYARVKAYGEDGESSWSSSCDFEPTVKVVIGSGTGTNSNVPTYTYYNNSLTQQIYTADEIGATEEGKAILSIDFKIISSNSSVSETTRNLDIYMVNTDSTSFSGSNSWIVVSAEDLVFSGDVTFVSNEWTTITLDNEFEYDGTKNLALIVDDNTGSYKNGFSFRTFTADSQAIRVYSDGTDYDPFNPSSYNGTVQSAKNQIRLLFGEKSEYPKPTRLTATEVTATTATLTWTENGTATAWVVEYSTDRDFENDVQTVSVSNDATTTLTGLIPETTYYARVKSSYGEEGESNWSTSFQFTPTKFILIGSGTETNRNLPTSSTGYSLTQQIYTADEIGATEAGKTILSIDFKSVSSSNSARNLDIYMVNTEKENFTGNKDWIAVSTDDLVFSGVVSFTADTWTTITLDDAFMYNGSNLAVIVDDNTGGLSFFTNSFYVFQAENQALYLTGSSSDLSPSNPSSLNGTRQSSKNQIRLLFDDADYIMPSRLTASGVTGTTATLTWTENGTATAWVVEYSTDSNFQNDVQTVNVTNDATTTLTGLSPETTYYVRVKSSYGDEGESNWTSAKQFTTIELYPAPSGLTASNVTDTEATLTWTENGTATEWVVEYTTDQNFENDVQSVSVSNEITTTLTGLTPETTYYARVKALGEEGESHWSTSCEFEPTQKVVIGSGTGTNSYVPTNILYNYSLTQQIYTADEIDTSAAGKAILSIDFMNTSSNKPTRNLDIYMVNTDSTSFSSSNGWIAVTTDDLVFSGEVTFVSKEWTTITLDNEFVYDGTNLAVIVDDNTGEWISSSYFLTFPADSQAIRIYSDGTDYDPFNPTSYNGTVQNNKNQIRLLFKEPLYEITLADDDREAEEGAKNTDLIADMNRQKADITIEGRTIYADGNWNTLCLPFNLTLEGSPLEGFTARTLESASLEDGTLTLTFGEAVDVMTAGTPYIVKSETVMDDITDPVFNGVTISSQTNNFESADGKVQFNGCYSPVAMTEGDESFLFLGADNTLYYPNADNILKAFRAYFTITADTEVKGVNIFFNGGGDDDVPTSIDLTKRDGGVSTGNAQDSWYSVSGMKIEGKPTVPGIYIRNGKKVMVK